MTSREPLLDGYGYQCLRASLIFEVPLDRAIVATFIDDELLRWTSICKPPPLVHNCPSRPVDAVINRTTSLHQTENLEVPALRRISLEFKKSAAFHTIFYSKKRKELAATAIDVFGNNPSWSKTSAHIPDHSHWKFSPPGNAHSPYQALKLPGISSTSRKRPVFTPHQLEEIIFLYCGYLFFSLYKNPSDLRAQLGLYVNKEPRCQWKESNSSFRSANS
ncbi:hypothetical protein J6590_025607 [Homalodisca vitripennis]|nr:hypothetical protein J6590_025607 [Homalodisca vitripennis]